MTYVSAISAQGWWSRTRAVLHDLGDLTRFATQLLTAPGYGHRPETITVPPPSAGPRPTVHAPRAAAPVLLVHGYLNTEQCWAPLLRRLHRTGFRDTSCLRYNTLTTGIPELAAALTRAARAAMERTSSDGVHLVGYSLGGLAVRYAVQRLGLETNTLSAVTIGTPHHGTPWARAAIGPAARQLRPDSAVLVTLPDLAADHPVRWLFLYSDCDLIAPSVSASAGRLSDAVHVPGRGHLGVLTDPRAAEAIVAHLCRADSAATAGAELLQGVA
ncbi:esterase/lipase family protein [Streptomyces sp. NPDC053542]|uniref:esterase/lipase family protein n=1 Tax=Streptomyces sp. NPDC053542 TaxID=3365710 RepID=UPI0037D36A69